jgi:hypothetical protein
MVLWYSGGNTWGSFIGFAQGYHSEQLPIGVSRFWSPTFIWFYIWFLVSTAILQGFGKLFPIIHGNVGLSGARLLFYLISGLRSRLVLLLMHGMYHFGI